MHARLSIGTSIICPIGVAAHPWGEGGGGVIIRLVWLFPPIRPNTEARLTGWRRVTQ